MNVVARHFVPPAAALLAICATALAQEPPPANQQERKPDQDLADMSIEDLMKVEVTSVSKKEQKLLEAPSAIYVLRGEDLRRTGVSSIPEALRMVPGIEVARVDSSKWAISARGFGSRFANKLLVMIDGRSVYTPLFSGVYWDVQDTDLGDIDRIEVIRGPGGTTWGANAVNGVINIITKSSKEGERLQATAGFGTEDREFGSVRWGGMVGENFAWRAFAKYSSWDSGYRGIDEWWTSRGGFRGDWTASADDAVTIIADYYYGKRHDELTWPDFNSPTLNTTFRETSVARGGDVLMRWRHTYGPKSSMELQAYWDHTQRDADIANEDRDTFDVALQFRFPLMGNQDIVVGAGYRASRDEIGDAPTINFAPGHYTQNLVSAFIQDELTLMEDKLRLTVGTKVEYNSYTQVEVQPSARLLWLPAVHHAVWGSVSRAVRTPSRAENDVSFDLEFMPGAPPVLTRISGDREYDSESLIAWELGYRVEPMTSLSLDAAVFYNEYNKLTSVEPGTPVVNVVPFVHVVVPVAFDNNLEGRTYGFEATARWQVIESVRATASYSFLRMNLDIDNDSTDTTSEDGERSSPKHQLYVRGTFDLVTNVQFDAVGRYVSALRDVPAYVEADLRLAWRPVSNLEAALVGQNLARPHHKEFRTGSLGTTVTDVEHGVYFSVSVKW